MTDLAAPSLSSAIDDVFILRDVNAFADAFVGLAGQLTGATNIHLLGRGEDGAPALIAGSAAVTDAQTDLARAVFTEPNGEVVEPDQMGMRLDLPGGAVGVVIAGTQGMANMPRALCHERLTLLRQVAARHFANPDVQQSQRLFALAPDVSRGDEGAMQQAADALAAVTGAGYAAVGWFDGSELTSLAISGQGKSAKRAALPAELRPVMAQAAGAGTLGPVLWSCVPAGRADGAILAVSDPQQNSAIIDGFARATAQCGNDGARKKRRLPVRALAFVAFIAAALAIPIPDGIEIPAELRAQTQRSITSPITAQLRDAFVTDAARVAAGQTVLAQLDTGEIDLELVSATAEQSELLLARETARADRNAAELSRLDLELERVAARIDLLRGRRASATITAPISGQVFDSKLDRLQGSILRQGETLLQIAGDGALELQLSIPHRDMGQIETGDTGDFRPDYDPTLRLPVTVNAISPAAQASDPTPVFTAIADLSVPEGSALRPGMGGIVILRREWKPAGVTLFAKLRDWGLIRLWY